MSQKKWFQLSITLSISLIFSAHAELDSLDEFETDSMVVEFHIEKGTGKSSWNTQDMPIEVELGDTLRFFNDDDVVHQLHTNGAPCPHGPPIAPGKSWDCEVKRVLDPKKSGALYDHGFGRKSEVWIEAIDPAAPQIIEFQIKKGTGMGSWNTKDTIIEVKVGDTLRFHNDDDIRHRLHTNGSPCPHGPNFEPGKSWDCAITRPFDALIKGPLYDHNVGPAAEVWIRAVK